MTPFRQSSKVASVALLLVVSGCTAAPASSGPDAVHRQAQEALTRWDAAVASSSGGPGIVLAGESTLFVGSDWGPNIDGGNAKLAMYAGLFETANPLPSEAPPDGTITWHDGSTQAVRVISAAQALDDMKATGTSKCLDCAPLQITGAKLTTATFQSNQGPLEAPAWEFSLKDTDVKLVQFAVGRFTPPPVPTPSDQGGGQAGQPWVGPSVESATVDAGGTTLIVTVVGAPDPGDKPCGADYTAEAVESDNAVVVIVYEHRNALPAACTAVGAARTVEVTLAKPLGSRTLISLEAQPISVTAAR